MSYLRSLFNRQNQREAPQSAPGPSRATATPRYLDYEGDSPAEHLEHFRSRLKEMERRLEAAMTTISEGVNERLENDYPDGRVVGVDGHLLEAVQQFVGDGFDTGELHAITDAVAKEKLAHPEASKTLHKVKNDLFALDKALKNFIRTHKSGADHDSAEALKESTAKVLADAKKECTIHSIGRRMSRVYYGTSPKEFHAKMILKGYYTPGQ